MATPSAQDSGTAQGTERAHIMDWHAPTMDSMRFEIPGLETSVLCRHCLTDPAVTLDNFSRPICKRCSKIESAKQIKREKMPGRNEKCPCGSGKKYKKCCMIRD